MVKLKRFAIYTHVIIKLTQIMKSQGIRVKMFFSFQITHTPYGIFIRFKLKIYTQYIPELNNKSFDTRIR
jgi:hypothetical protein